MDDLRTKTLSQLYTNRVKRWIKQRHELFNEFNIPMEKKEIFHTLNYIVRRGDLTLA